MQLEMAKADAADFFHTFGTVEELQQYFGLRPVSVERLAQHGIAVPSDAVDGAGRTHPRLSTLPMGFLAAPAIAQGAHESVIYGSEGGRLGRRARTRSCAQPRGALVQSQPAGARFARVAGATRYRHRRRVVLPAGSAQPPERHIWTALEACRISR